MVDYSSASIALKLIPLHKDVIDWLNDNFEEWAYYGWAFRDKVISLKCDADFIAFKLRWI